MSANQPECDCNVKPGRAHESWCNALKDPADQNPAVRAESERQQREASQR